MRALNLLPRRLYDWESFPEEVLHALVAYTVGMEAGDRLFAGTAGRFRTDCWQPALKAAGLPPTTPHALRHSTASRMVSDGVPLATVGRVLGNTVQVLSATYVHELAGDDKRLREAQDASWAVRGTSAARQA